MKVLYFHQHFSTPLGATGIRSYEMARSLVREGHQVTMVCGSYNGGNTGLIGPFKRGRRCGKVDGIDVIEFDLRYSNHTGFIGRSVLFFKFAFYSVGVALTAPCDLVFATTTPLTAGLPGIFARWIRGKQFVFEVRDLWPELPRAMGVIKNPLILGSMKILEWLSYRSAHRLIGLSPGIVQGIVKLGVPENRVALIPNGCDFQIFTSEVQPWQPEGIFEGDFLAVFAGTHGDANGLDSVLDAALELQRRNRLDIKILLVGQGKRKKDLMERAEREGLSNVVFHQPVSKDRLAGLFARADIGLQVLANIPAFYYGTSPNKFFDYISAGLPVLNNYPGWLAEMIVEHNCGFAVPAGDPVKFAKALESAADDRNELRLKGARAFELGAREFDREMLAERWINWLFGSGRRD